ncbi:hypothetical protein [Methanolapillus millepedarum]|uniref:Putative aromatic acid exporter C-terminal domain-containing protein n=1 Tax=Methanolapillus millepedarum TaxID=3028296 RepID=A0AA96V2D0_9EURY|nr:hypothetical protein MsAc7_06960 [Methanosarcinaceae archaeon Ac7]
MSAIQGKIESIKKDIEYIRLDGSDRMSRTYQVAIAYKDECPAAYNANWDTDTIIKALEVHIANLQVKEEEQKIRKKEMKLEKAKIKLQINTHIQSSSNSEAYVFDMSNKSFQSTVKIINEIQECDLSSDNKKELLKLLEEIKDSKEKNLKTAELLDFLSGMSANVVKAVLPFILGVIFPGIF